MFHVKHCLRADRIENMKGENMKKLYISQPMAGMEDQDILKEREKAIGLAEIYVGEPVEVIDSFFQGVPENKTPLWFLSKELELMSVADIVYFAPGWEKARRCKIEHDYVISCSMKIIDGNDFTI